MFTPIKNFITYMQRNANGNSIFGSNSSTIESAKMEAENIKTETETIKTEIENIKTENEIPKDLDKDDHVVKAIEDNMCQQAEDSSSNLEDMETNAITLTTMSAISTGNSCGFEDEDIEAQIDSSIMLKKPVKVTATNGSEILELKKSSTANCSIVISHDYNRNHHLIPTDDELEDFRHDPMEALGTTSSPCSNQLAEEFCSIGSAEEALERDLKPINDFTTENQMNDNKTEDEQKPNFDSDLEIGEEKDIETENEQNDIIDDLEVEEEKEVDTENEQNYMIEADSEEEPFLDLDNFKNNNVIVLDEVDLNTSTASIDTINTADDPLAIACEEQEAFAADKTAALEELNLLNTSQTSQDDDTRTTTDEDLRWIKTDLEENQPLGTSKVPLKDNASAEDIPEKEERNGEGSDSGLGSETSTLHTTSTSIADTSQLNTTGVTPSQTPNQIKSEDSNTILSSNVLRLKKSALNDLPKIYRSNLKRRLEVDDATDGLSSLTSTASLSNDHSCLSGSSQKKPKRSINFDTVQVYYFPRQQGFSCVPSAGGCTLGMGATHVAFKTLTLAEHAAELRRAHRMQLQEINPRGSSSDDSEESEEDYLSEGSGSDLDGESNGFLQPVSPKQRRALLKAAGIRKIDPSEKAECRNIRNSREVCGCTCRDFCDPETCACSQSGIKCQVDRDMFPCGCSRDACGNSIGRVEFNPTRVRTHYIHTLMRLEMENRQQQNPYSTAVVSPMTPTPSSYYQTHLQPQSNYSSGYASPAYNTASEIHQHTAASSYYHTQSPATSSSMYGQTTALEMTHNGGVATATVPSHYGIDNLDTSLFGGASAATPSYGEILPVPSYYGNLQTQASSYNTYHNTPYINATNNTASLSTSNTYSSCAVPSIPPFGTATTTEATGIYHSVSSLTSLETTTAPSCSVNGAASLEHDVSSSFISLSTPLASSSRLSQINDLLQHNRNATNALVAVSQNIEATDNKSDRAICLTQSNGNNSPIATPHLEDTHKSYMSFEELVTPLNPTALEIGDKDEQKLAPDITTTAKTLSSVVEETLTKDVDVSSPLLFGDRFLPQTTVCEEDQGSTTTVAVSASIESSTIEVSAGN